MITVEPRYSAETEYREESALFEATRALFPTLSFRFPEMQKKHSVAKEAKKVVLIEGTVTVSF